MTTMQVAEYLIAVSAPVRQPDNKVKDVTNYISYQVLHRNFAELVPFYNAYGVPIEELATVGADSSQEEGNILFSSEQLATNFINMMRTLYPDRTAHVTLRPVKVVTTFNFD